MEQTASIRTLRAMPGRTTHVERRGTVSEVTKQFVGDEPRDWWFERLRSLAPRSPARREHDNLVALSALGLRVPEALDHEDLDPPARLWPPRPGRGPRSRVRLAWVAHRSTLAEALASEPTSELLEELLALVTALHAAGWYHRDLYLSHVLLAEDGGLVLIDLGRARHQRAPRRRWLVKDLAALDLSAPAALSRSRRLRFLRGWLRAVEGVAPSDRAARRRWVREVARKRERLGAHRPRFEGRPESESASRPDAREGGA